MEKTHPGRTSLRPNNSLLRHICWSVFLNHDPMTVWVLVVNEFAAYFDDSGHPNDQFAVVVAGFLANQKQWLALEKEWKQALVAEGVTVFHATDLQAGKGEFEGWHSATKAAFLDELVSIILDNTET